MKRLSLAGVIVLGVSTLWLLRHGTVAGGADANPVGGGPRKVLYYRDPMHPAYTSDRPGKAPDCGMALQPVYAEENDSTSSPAIAGSSRIRIDPARQQMIGVRTGRVERTRTTDEIRTIGRVVADENRLFPVIAAGEGWVTSIAPGMATGNTVRRGQVLMSISGRDYTTAQRTYLYALRAAESRSPAGTSDLQDQADLTLQEAARALQGMGLGQAQLQLLTTARRPVTRYPVDRARGRCDRQPHGLPTAALRDRDGAVSDRRPAQGLDRREHLVARRSPNPGRHGCARVPSGPAGPAAARNRGRCGVTSRQDIPHDRPAAACRQSAARCCVRTGSWTWYSPSRCRKPRRCPPRL